MKMLVLLALLFFVGCEESGNQADPNMNQPSPSSPKLSHDSHSFSEPNKVQAVHLDLDIEVDFEAKIISGHASYQLDNKTGATQVIFDSRGLDIQKVTLGDANSIEELKFELGSKDPLKGQALSITIPKDAKQISIFYATPPGAAALQWLDPVQTAGKKQPFLFTQGQAILTRTWIPCQDGPGMRFTYNAKVKVPANLMAVMSATNPTELNENGIYNFEMKQAIPAYLMALSVGDLRFKEIGKETGVYAEPSVLDAAVYEFGDMQNMLEAAEELYGAYRWERYDVVVLPPSFPFGGMENPRLTFATPTILAGDRSLTALIAHELAHSWSGNLVTNETWDDFWLNEGFTVYFERRIMEKLYGESYAKMLGLLGYQDLKHSLETLGEDSDDTKLKLALTGRDPDDGMTDIAYEKGCFFLTNIEQNVGREKMDNFLKTYFDTYAFKTMTTERFVEYLKAELVGEDKELEAKLNIDGWIYSPGIPAEMKVPMSDRFTLVGEQIKSWEAGTAPEELTGSSDWTTHEWLHFIRHLPKGMDLVQMAGLDQAFKFTDSGNSEIQAAWFEHVIAHEYTAGYASLEAFLNRVGRRKFLSPLYKALAQTEKGKQMGRRIYADARANYHSVSVGTIDEILGWK